MYTTVHIYIKKDVRYSLAFCFGFGRSIAFGFGIGVYFGFCFGDAFAAIGLVVQAGLLSQS